MIKFLIEHVPEGIDKKSLNHEIDSWIKDELSLENPKYEIKEFKYNGSNITRELKIVIEIDSEETCNFSFKISLNI